MARSRGGGKVDLGGNVEEDAGNGLEGGGVPEVHPDVPRPAEGRGRDQRRPQEGLRPAPVPATAPGAEGRRRGGGGHSLGCVGCPGIRHKTPWLPPGVIRDGGLMTLGPGCVSRHRGSVGSYFRDVLMASRGGGRGPPATAAASAGDATSNGTRVRMRESIIGPKSQIVSRWLWLRVMVKVMIRVKIQNRWS